MDYQTIMADKEDVNIVESETCDGVSAKRKHFLGVSKQGNKWRARLQVHLGCYSNPEEAALVVKEKKAEYKEMLNGEGGLRKKRRRHEFEGRKLPCGVTREYGKFRVQIWHPVLKKYVSCGAYTTCEEAAVVADRKMTELRELYGGKPRGSSECEDEDMVLQETQSETEEAALVVKNKKAEFEGMLKGVDGLREKRRKHEFEGRKKRPFGVRRENEKFRVRFWHPVLKRDVSFGTYNTCEEAAVVADRKRAELRELYGGKPRGGCECEDDDKVLQETESESEEAALVVKNKKAEFEGMLKGVDGLREKRRKHEFEGRKKRPCGVRRENGKFRVRIWHPVLKRDVSFGTYSTCEEAAVVAVRKRTELWELYGGKPRGGSECEDDDKVLQETESESEEAALVVKNKKAEFEGMLKGVDGLREKRRKHEFEGRKKRPCGVRRENEKFRVRFWHPVLKRDVSFGTYNTCEEAAVVADRKRTELWELYGGKPRGSSECEDDDKVLQETESETEEAAVVADRKTADFGEVYGGEVRGSSECEDDDEVLQECTDEQTSDVKVPAGVRRVRSGKRVARIKDLVSCDRIWLGTYDTPEEAIRCYNKENDVLDTKMKRAEFEEFKGKEDLTIVENETCDGVSAKRKHLFGVSKKGNKWQARIRHPKLKVTVHLGYYNTPEEAALVVKTKKAEFEGTLKGVDGLREKRRRHEFEGRKLPCGVRRENGKFRVRFWHPVLKRDVSFGTYSTYEEAAVIADRKRAELRELYGGKPTGSSECEVDDKVLQETESETEEAALVADRKTADLEEVYGGKVRGSSECEDGDEILQEIESKVAGKFEYANEQTSGLKLPAGVRRVRSGKRVARFKDPGSWARIWLGTYDTAEEAIQSYDKNVAVQMGYDGLNNVENDDKPNCGVVDVPDKLECEFVQGFPTSNIEPGTTNSACVRHKRVIDKTSQRKTTCCLDFDEAVSAGFINEYGQLVGKYRELDEQLFLGLTDENFAAS